MFITNLELARHERGLTQRELGEAVHEATGTQVSQTLISNVEHGRRAYSDQTEALREFLGFESIDQLWQGRNVRIRRVRSRQRVPEAVA